MLTGTPGTHRSIASPPFRPTRASRRATLPATLMAAIVAGLVVLVSAPEPAHGQITESNIGTLGDYAPADTARLDSPPSLGATLMRLAFALALVIGLVFVVARLAKKYMPAQIVGGRRGPIEVLSVKSLAPRKSLVLVRVQDKTVLLGLTPQSVNFLTDIDEGRGGWEEAAVQSGLAAVAGGLEGGAEG